MSKKILFIIDRLSAGAGRVVYDLVNNLNKKKFDITIAVIYPDSDLKHLFKKLDVSIINLNKNPGKDTGLILRLKNLIKKEKFDIVHTHNVDAYEYGVLAAWLAKVPKIIHTSHGKSVKSGRLSKLREKFFHKFISLFLNEYIVVSKDLGRYVSRNWCLNTKKIKVIHNGMDTNLYKPAKISRKNFSLGIKKKDKIITIIAGLRPVKDHVTLIRAMKIVSEKIPNSRLIIVGDGSERKKLKNLTKKLNLEDHIIFLGNRKDIVNLWNVSDLGVLCSLDECLSISLLEGMACGIPFVATKVGGNPEVIRIGQEGFLVKPKNHKLLARNIIRILRDSKNRKKLGINARKKVEKDFTLKKMSKRYEKVYLK